MQTRQTYWFIFSHIYDIIIVNVFYMDGSGSVRCERVQMANNMLSIVMVIM